MLFLFFVPLQPKFTQIMRQTILLGLLILTCSLSAQNDAFEAFRKQQAEKFKQTKDNQQAQYDAFRKRANEQYARFMREPWTAFDEQQEDTVRQEKRPESGVPRTRKCAPSDRCGRFRARCP